MTLIDICDIPQVIWYKNYVSRTIFDGLIATSVIQNMNYEKLNILSKLISKFYIQLHIKVGI